MMMCNDNDVDRLVDWLKMEEEEEGKEIAIKQTGASPVIKEIVLGNAQFKKTLVFISFRAQSVHNFIHFKQHLYTLYVNYIKFSTIFE